MITSSFKVYVNDSDDRDVIAGQATLGVEFLRSVPDMDAILVPIGGGRYV